MGLKGFYQRHKYGVIAAAAVAGIALAAIAVSAAGRNSALESSFGSGSGAAGAEAGGSLEARLLHAPLAEMTAQDIEALRQALKRQHDRLVSDGVEPVRMYCPQECLESVRNEVLPYVQAEVLMPVNITPFKFDGRKDRRYSADYNPATKTATMRTLDVEYRIVAHETIHDQGEEDEAITEALSMEIVANMTLSGNQEAKSLFLSQLINKIGVLQAVSKLGMPSEPESFIELLKSGEEHPDAIKVFPYQDETVYANYYRDPLLIVLKAMGGEKITEGSYTLDGIYRLGVQLDPEISASVRNYYFRRNLEMQESSVNALVKGRVDNSFLSIKEAEQFLDNANKWSQMQDYKHHRATIDWIIGATLLRDGNIGSIYSAMVFLQKACDVDPKGMLRDPRLNATKLTGIEFLLCDKDSGNDPSIEVIEGAIDYEAKAAAVRAYADVLSRYFRSGELNAVKGSILSLKEAAYELLPKEGKMETQEYGNARQVFKSAMLVVGDVSLVTGDYDGALRAYDDFFEKTASPAFILQNDGKAYAWTVKFEEVPAARWELLRDRFYEGMKDKGIVAVAPEDVIAAYAKLVGNR